MYDQILKLFKHDILQTVCEFHQIYNFDAVGTKTNQLDSEDKGSEIKVTTRPDMVKKGTMGILKVVCSKSKAF